jgi:hypothetical protein
LFWRNENARFDFPTLPRGLSGPPPPPPTTTTSISISISTESQQQCFES